MLLRRHRSDKDGERQTEQSNQERQTPETESLEEKTVKELKEIAKDREIEGYSEMKKAELIEALEG